MEPVVNVTHATERDVFPEERRVVTAAPVDDEADLREGPTASAVRDAPLRGIEGVGDLSRRRTFVEERADDCLGGLPTLADDVGVFPR